MLLINGLKTPWLIQTLLLLAVSVTVVTAEPITISVSGQINFSNYGDGTPFSAIPVGTSYSGQVTYDSSDSAVTVLPSQAAFFVGGAAEGVSATVGQYAFSSIGNPYTSIAIGQRLPPVTTEIFEIDNNWEVPNSGRTGSAGSLPLTGIGLQLLGSPGLLTSNSSLPTSLNFSDLIRNDGSFYTEFFLDFGTIDPTNTDGAFVTGDITAISIQSAPEPNPGFLVGAMILVGALARVAVARTVKNAVLL